MTRNQIDKKILEAIATLKNEGKSQTVSNIEQITGLLKYQIYSSKHRHQLEIRGKEAKAIQQARAIQLAPETLSAAKDSDKSLHANTLTAPGKAKAVNLDLSYKLLESALKIDMKDATTDDIDAAIESLTFLFKKSIERLELEKSRLQ